MGDLKRSAGLLGGRGSAGERWRQNSGDKAVVIQAGEEGPGLGAWLEDAGPALEVQHVGQKSGASVL